MHCSAGTAIQMCVLFPKESPMLGLPFSLVVRGGAERDGASIFVDGRWVWTVLWMEMGGWTGVGTLLREWNCLARPI